MSRLRILIIEDDETLRKVMRILFFDHELHEASSLSEARAARGQHEFDVVLCDWQLPDGHGDSFLRELHDGEDHALRLLHSAMEPPDVDDLLERGVIARFFRKPAWRELALHLAQVRPRRSTSQVQVMTTSSEKRQEPRTPIELTAYVRCESWQAVRRLYTSDLSQGGMALRSSEPAKLGAPVRVALTLPDGLKLRLKGEVRYSTAVYEESGAVSWKIGVRVHDPGERARLVLRALLRARTENSGGVGAQNATGGGI